jgi:hypothetical protein
MNTAKIYAVISAGGVAVLLAGCGGSPTYSPAASASSTATPSASQSASVADRAPGREVNDLPLGRGVQVSGTATDDKGNDVDYVKTVTVGSRPKFNKDKRYVKHEYVGLEVTYTGVSGLAPYNAFDWDLRASNGDTVNASETFGGIEPALGSGTLRPGKKAHGYITFDVKPGTYTLELNEGVANVVTPSWKVTVK